MIAVTPFGFRVLKGDVVSKIFAVLNLLRGLAQQVARQSVAEKRALSALANVEKQVAERREQRLRRTLRLLGDCNLLLARAADERALLVGICRLIVDTGGYPLAWIGFAAPDAGKSVLPWRNSAMRAAAGRASPCP